MVNNNHEISCQCFYMYSGQKCEIESQEVVFRRKVITTAKIISILVILLTFCLFIICDFITFCQRKKLESKKTKDKRYRFLYSN